MPPRRKKWTEEEERTLIDKYGDMVSDGTLAKMKTREKRFKPIAAHVNLLHHSRDPIAFPWQWTWKDASTKVQNMRHQYLLVKQKIKKPRPVLGTVDEDVETEEEFDWVEGVSHWPNFLRYKSVFGDHPLGGFGSVNCINGVNGLNCVNGVNCVNGGGGGGSGNDLMNRGFGGGGGGGEYDGEEGEENEENQEMNCGDGNGEVNGNVNVNGNGNVNGHDQVKEDGEEGIECEEVEGAFGELREREGRFEEREAARERERRRREQVWLERERERERRLEEWEREREEREQVREKLMRERIREVEAMEKESVEREMRWREEELRMEREWEERMDRRRLDWKNRINDMLNQHRVAMDQIQSRILHDQQSLMSQLIGILSQWTGHPTALSDHTGAGNAYLSQMIQNLHHVNGIVHSENRVDGDNQDDQFIVDDG
ncbi:hypothetical protein Scep_010621 [Stephania cephalantha]|uniref:Uncharacterized protein n=1 Tax=Stephania cephalantha TaxID=152367 RepID=A0AAP0JXN6_9MAGN